MKRSRLREPPSYRMVSERRAAAEVLCGLAAGAALGLGLVQPSGALIAVALFFLVCWLMIDVGAPKPGDPRFIVLVKQDARAPIHYGPFASYHQAQLHAERVGGEVVPLTIPVWGR